MIAVIGDARNERSISLHTSAGFTHVGTMKSCGWKFNQWLDVLIMEKSIGDGNSTFPE
jgi:L-amino acid N-acyltransferase YncA